MKTSFNKFVYYGFLLLGVYFILFQKNFSDATIYLGIALAFDPFNTEQPWNERPMWQRAWLIVHLACIALLFGFIVGIGDR